MIARPGSHEAGAVPGSQDGPEVPRADLEALTRDGIIGHPAAFDVTWVDRLHSDVLRAFEEARTRPGGAIGRGPQRWYVEVHPEQLGGFVDLVTHPWVVAISRASPGMAAVPGRCTAAHAATRCHLGQVRPGAASGDREPQRARAARGRARGGRARQLGEPARGRPPPPRPEPPTHQDHQRKRSSAHDCHPPSAHPHARSGTAPRAGLVPSCLRPLRRPGEAVLPGEGAGYWRPARPPCWASCSPAPWPRRRPRTDPAR